MTRRNARRYWHGEGIVAVVTVLGAAGIGAAIAFVLTRLTGA